MKHITRSAEGDARRARDGRPRSRRRTRRARRGGRRGAGRRAHDARRPLRLLRRRRSRRWASRRSPGTGTRAPSTSRASASSSSSVRGRGRARSRSRSPSSEALDPELFKVVADGLVQEAGVEPLLHCPAVEPIVDGGRRHRRHHREQVGAAGGPGGARHRRHRRRRPGLSRRGAVSQDPGRRDDGRHCGLLVLRRRQAALPRLRSGDIAHLRRLGTVLEHGDLGQRGPALQPVPSGAVRRGAPGRPHPRGRQQHRRHLGPAHRRRRGDLPEHGRDEGLRLHRRARPHARGDRGTAAGDDGDRGAAPLRPRLRARPAAHLRHDSRDPRLPQDPSAATTSPATTSAARRASTTPSASAPNSSTATAASSCPPPAATSRCPTASSSRGRSTTCWSPAAAWPATRSRTRPHAA